MKRKTAAVIALGAVLVAGSMTAIFVQNASTATAEPDSAAAPQQAYSEVMILDGFTVQVNGQALVPNIQPRLAKDTMLVPLRSIAEALGAEVSYNDVTGTITAVKGDERVELTPGSAVAVKNSALVKLAYPPVRDGDTVLVPLRFFAEAFGTAVKWDGAGKRVTVDAEDYLLPAVGSYDKLKELLASVSGMNDTGIMIGPGMAKVTVVDQAGTVAGNAVQDTGAAASPKMKEPANSKTGAATDYSGTNVQVEGVDEGDVVKTDGTYLYQVNGKRILITRAVPAGSMALEAEIRLTDANFSPAELYVDEDRLTVIGSSRKLKQETRQDAQMSKKLIAPLQDNTVKTLVYDITDRKTPKLVREVETEGDLIASRKIGSQVYVIANRYLNRYSVLNDGEGQPAAPSYRDTAQLGQWVEAKYEDIRYFPDSPYSAYMVITGIDEASPDKPADVSVYLGSAQNVFASADHLYTAFPRRQVQENRIMTADNGTAVTSIQVEEETEIYKFLMHDGKVSFSAKGSVPGTVLNQFSMDEHNGYFRIATTKGNSWRRAGETSSNNVYVLNEDMGVTGKIEDIAPGESIYSVRFMGNRGYMVTFQKVDPLFVLDFSNPAAPSILGQLKIPGYSDYLHPYDETHLIGFGKDAVVVTDERYEKTAEPQNGTAYYQGMKVSMFDVSDMARPKELFQTVIGDRGTDSELLRNHKALLFSKEKNLLAFPVTVAKVPDSQKASPQAYGQFAFQGAYVYQVDLLEGFRLKGTISHMNADEQQKAGGVWYGGKHQVERVLYIGDTLYSLSPGQVRANDLESLAETGRLELP